MSEADNLEIWIREVMSKIIESLGPNIEDARYEKVESTSSFISTFCHVCLMFKNKMRNESEIFSILLKRPLKINTLTQNLLNVDTQFHNEIVFYRMYAETVEHCPRCFYSDNRSPTDSIIALENVTKRGYYASTYKYDIPLEYTLAAMREMGRFHAKGYAMKEMQREKFFDIVKHLGEVRYKRTGENDMFIEVLKMSTIRVVEYLRSHGHDEIFCDKLEAVFSNVFNEVMIKTVEPLEPLSTLCHGDFTIDNTLFKTDDDGQHHAMLIDFAHVRYGTPVIDLATYLFLSCSNELRADKLFEMLRTYHNALKKYLLEAGVGNIEIYSYEALLEDYKRGALFGFVIATFYLPVLMGHFTVDFNEIESIVTNNSFKYCGGDEMSKILADMLLQIRDLGCLKQFL